MDFVVTVVQQFGFPIFCVICCFWYINKTNKEYREDFNALHQTHTEEVKHLTTALTQNTEVVRDIKNYIEYKMGDD